ncbi:MAG: hypothetical protein GXO78_14950 [Calditrichaeota bacterium]|nr:hypothetical protein [Calditrichota bacterium]
MAKNPEIDPEIIKKTFDLCRSFALNILGTELTTQFLKDSYRKILPYFHVLKHFKLNDTAHLNIAKNTLTDKELLSFAVWMQQFLKEIQHFMIGLEKIEIESLTESLKEPLQQMGFYEYFHQAEELEY